MVLIMTVGTILISYTSNFFIAESRTEWIEKSALNNKTLTPLTAWSHTILAVFFTILTFYTVFELREEAKQIYKETSK